MNRSSEEVALPFGVVTETVPVSTVPGSATWRVDGEAALGTANPEWNLTLSLMGNASKFAPETVTACPVLTIAGENPVIDGPLLDVKTMNERVLVAVVVPTVTEIGPDV